MPTKAKSGQTGSKKDAAGGGRSPMRCKSRCSRRRSWPRWSGPNPCRAARWCSKVWDYIKKHDLQNPENRREILADDKLEAVFGKKKVTMFEMNKHLAQHLK